MTTANREIKSRQIGAHMMALLVCAVWATTFVCSKELLAYYTPAQVMLMRFVLAYFVLWLLRSRPLRWQGRGERWFSPAAIPLPGCWNRLTTRPRCAPRNTHIVKAWQREKGLNFKDSP